MNKDDYILIGKITGVFGIKGELKVYTESDFVEYRFRKGAKILLNSKKQEKIVTVSSMRVHKNNVLITIDNLRDINLVEQYVGFDVYAPSDDEVPLEDDEYLVDDLVGFKVVDEDDNYLGEVTDFIEVPQGYIMEVKDKGKKQLIPFVDEFIIDITDDTIVVKVLEICQ